MVETDLCITVDDELKKAFEDFCDDIGISVSKAICIYLETVVKEQRIPFSIQYDSFYSKENMDYLKQAAQDMNDGKGVEHSLIEEDEA